MKKQIIILILAMFSLNGQAQNTAGSDSIQIGEGIVITSLSTSDDQANSMAIQKDGKILVAGYSNTSFAIVRYMPDGLLDQAFGNRGVVVASIRSGDDNSSALAVQPDGKIIVAGSSFSGTSNDFALVRCNVDGTLDSAFGKAGIVITSIRKGNDNASAIVIQPDGKIIVAGSSNSGSDDDFALVRYNSNGTVDPSFGENGVVITALQSGNDRAQAAAIGAGGKIIVAGYSNTDIAVVRYNPNGALDPSFGRGGMVINSLRSGEDQASAVCIQPDGKIVIAGSSDNGANFDFAMVRYDTSGNRDPGFGNDGVVITAVRQGDDKAFAICIQADNKLVAAGSSNDGLYNDFALIRYNVNGTPDKTFGKNGIVITSIRSGDDHATAAAIQKDGKILAAGNSDNGSSNDFAVIRYNNGGTFDNGFGKGIK
jgi:uncharacterized delta-60 repeat protein